MRGRRRAVIAVLTMAAALALVVPAGAAGAQQPPPVRPVPSLDLERYQGRWLQIAALPVSFL